MNIEKLCLLLLNTDQFTLQDIHLEDGKIRLSVESTAHSAACPACSKKSSRVHSRYFRYPTDLAWAEWAVTIQLQVKRFFCHNPACSKRTFAERFPNFLDVYSRRTERVLAKQRLLSVNICSRIAELLLWKDHIGLSDTSLNRLIRTLPEPRNPSIRVLGVDDWAKRKGQRYGTILVDLERGAVVDLLQDRTADTLAQWLKKHPEIEIVSRDRSQTYAEGIDRGASQAAQVADRWHLLKNASDTLFKVLQQEYAVIQKQLEQKAQAIKLDEREIELTGRERALTQAEQRRKERMLQARQYQQQGWSQKEIACRLGIHPKTVRRYMYRGSPQAPRQRTHRLLDRYKPYLLQRWNEGCHNGMQLYREIQSQGFAGHETTVRTFIQQLRSASERTGKVLPSDPTQTAPTLRTLTWWVSKRHQDRDADDEKILLQISQGQPKLQESIALARSFAEMIREQQSEKLDAWLERAEQSGYRTWRNFATGLRQDEAAVRGALTSSWSNGPTEGHINRLKCLKRLMYGRAKDDLLRKRVLWQGHRSFT